MRSPISWFHVLPSRLQYVWKQWRMTRYWNATQRPINDDDRKALEELNEVIRRGEYDD